MRKTADLIDSKLSRAEDFTHFLWKRHARDEVLRGCLPELVATDGLTIRRMAAQGQHLFYQEFEDAPTAMAVMERIESGGSPGLALVGYAMFADRDALAILHTGEHLEPGWLAFPYDRGGGGPSRIPTLPVRVANLPKLRIVGGAALTWRSGELAIDGAVEQCGDSFLETDYAFNMTEHLVDWRLAATVIKDGEQREVRLARPDTPIDEFDRTGPLRFEASFALDRVIYEQFSGPGLQIWFVLEFDRELFCLPKDWRTWWLSVDLVESATPLGRR